MRSGSSALWRYLADHPRVTPAATKELHFFDKHYDRGLDWYRRQFSPAPGIVTGEGTPAYLKAPHAIDRIGHDLPTTRMIAILRHPVERAYSHYNMRRARGTEHRPWDEVVHSELADPAHSRYVGGSLYGAQLAHLHRVVASDRIKVIAFESLRDAPQETFAEVCDYLGVEQFMPASVGRVVNSYFELRSGRARKLMKRWRNVRLVTSVVGRLNHVQTAYEPMSDVTRNAVTAALADDAERAITIAGWTHDPWGLR